MNASTTAELLDATELFARRYVVLDEPQATRQSSGAPHLGDRAAHPEGRTSGSPMADGSAARRRLLGRPARSTRWPEHAGSTIARLRRGPVPDVDARRRRPLFLDKVDAVKLASWGRDRGVASLPYSCVRGTLGKPRSRPPPQESSGELDGVSLRRLEPKHDEVDALSGRSPPPVGDEKRGRETIPGGAAPSWRSLDDVAAPRSPNRALASRPQSKPHDRSKAAWWFEKPAGGNRRNTLLDVQQAGPTVGDVEARKEKVDAGRLEQPNATTACSS